MARPTEQEPNNYLAQVVEKEAGVLANLLENSWTGRPAGRHMAMNARRTWETILEEHYVRLRHVTCGARSDEVIELHWAYVEDAYGDALARLPEHYEEWDLKQIWQEAGRESLKHALAVWLGDPYMRLPLIRFVRPKNG